MFFIQCDDTVEGSSRQKIPIAKRKKCSNWIKGSDSSFSNRFCTCVPMFTFSDSQGGVFLGSSENVNKRNSGDHGVQLHTD